MSDNRRHITLVLRSWRLVAAVWIVATLSLFAHGAIGFERPVYVHVDGVGTVPQQVARNLEAYRCEPRATCVSAVSWRPPCETRSCVLRESAVSGLVVALLAALALLMRSLVAWLRRRRSPEAAD